MVSEERIRWILEVLGAEQGAASLKKQTAALIESEKAANQLSAELKANARMSDLAVRSAERQAAAQRKAAAEQAAVAKAEQKLANERRAYAAQFSSQMSSTSVLLARGSDGWEVYSKKTQKAASLMTAFGSAVTGVSPQLAQLAQGAGRAAPAIEALTGLIGGGVGAAVAGGLLGVLGAGVVAWQYYAESQDLAKASAADMNVTLETQIELLQKADRAANQRALVAEGLAGPEAQQAELRRLESERDRIRGRMNQLRSDDDKFTLAPGASPKEFSRLVKLDEQNARAIEKALANRNRSLKEEGEIAGDDDDGEKRKGPAKERPFNPTRGDRLAEAEAILRGSRSTTFGGDSTLFAADAQTTRRGGLEGLEADAKRQREFAERFSGGLKSGDDAGDKVKAQLDREFDAKKAARQRDLDDQLSLHEQELLLYEEKEKRIALFHDAIREGAHSAWSMAGAAAANALAQMAMGQKVSLKAILQSLGAQAIASGTIKLFEAAFAAFTFNPAAAGMAAVGAAEVAFGATLAGGASAMGGGGKGAGGVGGGSGESGRKPMSPTFVQQGPITAMNPTGATVYQFNSIIAPTAREGQLVKQAEFEKNLQGR